MKTATTWPPLTCQGRTLHLRGGVLGEESVRLETAAGHDDEGVGIFLAGAAV